MSDYYERNTNSLRDQRRKKRRRQAIIRRIIFAVALLAVAASITILVLFLLGKMNGGTEQPGQSQPVSTESTGGDETDAAGETQATVPSAVDQSVLERAEVLAAGYDYDGAIELLKSQPQFGSDAGLDSIIAGYEQTKAGCVQVDMTQVPHVFFHTLIVDFDRCFASYHNQSLMNGYNAWMITIDEFKETIKELYENDYVILNISDIYTKDSNGNYSPNTSVYLPAGKKGVVFSYDDTAYYCQYMDWGMADRMVFDENGDIKCEYTDTSGNTTMGDYDHVPILIDFCREHPDFAYHGHKGTLALTGYNGVFGYRTEFRMWEFPSSDESAWIKANPWCVESELETYKSQAKEMAAALKENGFEFACHTWGHRHCDQKSLDWLQQDTSWWLERVGCIIGETDIFVYPHGSDIAGTEDYTGANEKYAYLKSKGFGVFCGVDGSSYVWNQFRSDYVRQSRIDIDGYLMYQTLTGSSSTLKKLGLDVEKIFDERRPTPVVTG